MMGADLVVFIGPTLSAVEARKYLDAIYLPPAGRGDVVRAVIDHAPSAVVLIDGVFAQSPAVRHKEILWAMARGVQIYGAASMGALRAAELWSNGMIGHGMIYRWYRRTALADDADVTVPMAPPEFGSHALGDALVDIRLTLRKAERSGLIEKQLRQSLESLARSIHFSARTFRTLLARAESVHGQTEQIEVLKSWIANEAVAQKRTDAVNLLMYLSAKEKIPKMQPLYTEFELTESFAFDLEYCNLLDCLLNKGT